MLFTIRAVSVIISITRWLICYRRRKRSWQSWQGQMWKMRRLCSCKLHYTMAPKSRCSLVMCKVTAGTAHFAPLVEGPLVWCMLVLPRLVNRWPSSAFLDFVVILDRLRCNRRLPCPLTYTTPMWFSTSLVVLPQHTLPSSCSTYQVGHYTLSWQTLVPFPRPLSDASWLTL